MLNEHQLKVAKFFATTTHDMVIQSRAGSGKTKLIISLTGLGKNKGKRVLFGAFTNATGAELKKREPRLSPLIRTSHSLGLAAIRRSLSCEVEVEAHKYSRILRGLISSPEFEKACNDKGLKPKLFSAPMTISEIGRNLNQLQVSLTNDGHLFTPLIDAALESYLLTKAIQEGLKESKEGIIGFPDMISFPLHPDVYNPGSFQKYDLIYLDEAQDLSEAQLQIYHNSRSSECQMIAVGDDYQSIFAFAGATGSSLQELTRLYQAKTFTMPLCYRCPIEVLDLARAIVPDIQGLDRHGDVQEHADIDQAIINLATKPGSRLALARTNSALIPLALRLLNDGIPFTFIGDSLENRLKTRLSFYRDTINFNNLQAALEKGKRRGNDLDECLAHLLNGSSRYSEMFGAIRRIFYNSSASIRLSTVHSAKGTEANHVLIWGINFFPHSGAETEIELQQEENLLYVAYTRSKETLEILHL